MSERAAPFYCPYCGEEHLEPYQEGDGRTEGRRAPIAAESRQAAKDEDGTWYCGDCVRVFKLKFLGVGPRRTHKETSR
jgi:hypothetical protein